jgi:hypothetical protein
MDFKFWLKNEVVEPMKPTSSVKRSVFIKNKGTNVAKPILQFKWKTKLGNEVKLHFDKKDENSYDVVFYVNDTHFDDETANEDTIRDPEVLSSVIFVLRKKADDLKANRLTFDAQKSDKDYKKVFNLPLEPSKSQTLDSVKELLFKLKNRTPVMIPVKQSLIDLAAKLNKPIPKERPDIDPKWIEILEKTLREVQVNQLISSEDDFFNFSNPFESIGYDPKDLIENIKRWNQVVKSRSEEGWIRYKNRRAEVYDRLMKRHFGDWKIQRNANRFELTR